MWSFVSCGPASISWSYFSITYLYESAPAHLLMRVAYVSPFACGLGHAARGAALVAAGRRAGIDIRAFGPPNWAPRVLAFAPSLLLGDLDPTWLNGLRRCLGVEAWLLLRWLPLERRRVADGWARRIAIEPIARGLPGITDCVPPIVGDRRFTPTDGQELRAGYNAWWESVWFGYHDRVRWTDGGSPERAARMAGSATMTENGADVLMEMIRAAM